MIYAIPFACAFVAGALLEWLGVPSGFLLGAIVATLVVCRLYPRGEPPPLSLTFVQVTLGVSIGLLFRDWNLDYALTILPSLALLVACLAVQVSASYAWLRRRAGWSRLDALLAAYPGAMAAVLDLLDRQKASPKVVLVHVTRLLLLTFAATLLIGEARTPAGSTASAGLPTLATMAAIIGTAIGLGWALERIRVPAPYMVTSIVLTAAAAQGGLTDGFAVPRPVMALAEVALGLLITIKVRELDLGAIGRSARSGLAAVGLAFGATALFAWAGSNLLGVDPAVLALSYVPGAVESVAVVALAAQLDVAFIISHHLLRLLIVHLAPVLFVGRVELETPART